jgi:hypothetical protein
MIMFPELPESASLTEFNGKMDEVSVWNYARSMAEKPEDIYWNRPFRYLYRKNKRRE